VIRFAEVLADRGCARTRGASLVSFHVRVQSKSTTIVDMKSRSTSQQKLLISITPEQVRAGRALLNMSQSTLAKLAKLGLSTIVDFEKSRRNVSDTALDAIHAALQSEGVIFVSQNGEGPGVRLMKRLPKKR
jgi:DNA-binding transcriptional regulator YiaG